MNWDGLQVFLAVARTGRISAAARRLSVEHTTVARRLAALEAELGVPLFYRTTTGYRLTANGQNCLAQAEAMEQAALGLAARAREGGLVGGRVRIAMAPEFASHWLVPSLKAFYSRHPRIVLQVLVGTRQRDLARGEAELAIQAPRPRGQRITAARIAHTTLRLYAARSLARDGRWRVTGPDTLCGAPLLAYTPEFRMLQGAAWFQLLLGGSPPALETNSTHALIAAARAGIGIAVLPRFVARAYDDLVPVSDAVAEHDVWLVTHPELRRDPKTRAAGEFLKSIATGPAGIL